jgi:DNA modification methylase
LGCCPFDANLVVEKVFDPMGNGERKMNHANGAFTSQLRAKSQRRRKTIERLAEPAAAARKRRNDLLPPLEVTSIALDELRAPKRNVRKRDEAHIREIANSIGAFGFCEPILVGDDNEIIHGALKAAAARLLNLTYIPCIRIAHLSDVERRTLRVALNRHAENGEWDLDALKLEFQELILADAPIEVSGFTLDEVDHILLDEGAQTTEVGPLAPQEGAVGTSRIGDVFKLGAHRLVCGDATDPSTWRALMAGGQAARLLLSDEPYNVKIAGHVSSSEHREFPMASGEMSESEFLGFNVAWIEAAVPYLVDGAVFGTFIDWRSYPTVHAAATKLGFAPLNLIVWGKTNAGMGSLYRSQHELLPLFKKGTAPHANNVALGKRGRWRSNLWTYPGASSLGSDARRGLQDHPTVKPVAMLEDALLDLTNRGDAVLDPFLGSGSTLIACEKTGRVCRGIELDPIYADVIIRRFEAATGVPAVFEESGELFTDLAARRLRERTGSLSGGEGRGGAAEYSGATGSGATSTGPNGATDQRD